MRLLKKKKTKTKVEVPQKSVNIDEMLKVASKSSYADVSAFAKEQRTKIEVIDTTKEKLLKDIFYYEQKKEEGLAFIDNKIRGINENLAKYEKIKRTYDEKDTERRKSNAKKIAESYNTKKLVNILKNYGFDLTINQMAAYSLIVIAIPVVIAVISQLQLKYISIVGVIGFLTTPAAIFAFYRQKFNERRFEMVIDYLTNILPIFMQKAKITYTLNEVKELTRYQMRDVIVEALNYISENVDDPNAERTALEMIENEFPNSRIKAVHNLMLTIEFQNSTNFKDVCQDMYIDIDGWIRRVNDFQQDLKDRRTKLLLLCGVTLAMNCLFVFLYTGTEYFKGFTDQVAYQISTTLFILSIIAVAAFALSRLNGQWLIDDETVTEEESLKRAYNVWEAGRQKIKRPELILGVLSLAGGLYCFWLPNYGIAITLIFMGVMMLTAQSRKYNSAFKKLKAHFSIEFPNWLRQITLNLHTQTVLNAIEESQYTASYPMFRQLDNFMADAHTNPTSLKPYSELLRDFDLKDAQSSIKVLYSVQTYGQEEIKDQITSLVTRNQAMLDKSESLKNQRNLAGVEALGYIPMVIFSISMIVNMFLLFSFLMTMIGSALDGSFLG